MRFNQTENDVKKAISDFLVIKAIHHWRQNSGGMAQEYNQKNTGKLKKRWFWFMKWLFPVLADPLVFLDIGGILPNGKYFEVEVKAQGKKPTAAQKHTIEYINQHTMAVALWANNIDMFMEKFERILRESGREL